MPEKRNLTALLNDFFARWRNYRTKIPDESHITLPLYGFFVRLRNNKFELGIDQYMLLIEAMRSGFGLQSVKDLSFITKKLWLKPTDDEALFDHLFNISLDLERVVHKTVDDTNKEKDPNADPDDIPSTKKPEDDITEKPVPQKEKIIEPVDLQEEGFLTLNVREVEQSSADLSIQTESLADTGKNYILKPDYYPESPRSLQQAWRFLRKEGNKTHLNEIDIDATIKQITTEGFMVNPVYKVNTANKSSVILLLDHQGSMVPFKSLVQLIETALVKSGTSILKKYFFHNVPGKYLFLNTTHTKADNFEKLIESGIQNDGLIILSDAGAARNSFVTERINGTIDFLKKIRKISEHVVWLNPMPKNRWMKNSAEEISKFVPMFECNENGIRSTVKVLKGK